MYEYQATIIRHIDADTTWVSLDLGCDIAVKLIIRWYGINAPKRGTVAGALATTYVNEILPVGSTCLVRTLKDKKEKYGRYLGIFYWNQDDLVSINRHMILAGHAEPYMGEDKEKI